MFGLKGARFLLRRRRLGLWVTPFADPGDQYRERSEIDQWRRRDPLETYPQRLLDFGVATQTELDELAASVDAEIEAAVEFATNSPNPDLSEAFDDVYA